MDATLPPIRPKSRSGSSGRGGTRSGSDSMSARSARSIGTGSGTEGKNGEEDDNAVFFWGVNGGHLQVSDGRAFKVCLTALVE